MMTVGQHDSAWLDVMEKKIPAISKSLRVSNMLMAAKELYKLGKIDKETYSKSIFNAMEIEGFKLYED